jgi:hypothetical protein
VRYSYGEEATRAESGSSAQVNLTTLINVRLDNLDARVGRIEADVHAFAMRWYTGRSFRTRLTASSISSRSSALRAASNACRAVLPSPALLWITRHWKRSGPGVCWVVGTGRDRGIAAEEKSFGRIDDAQRTCCRAGLCVGRPIRPSHQSQPTRSPGVCLGFAHGTYSPHQKDTAGEVL